MIARMHHKMAFSRLSHAGEAGIVATFELAERRGFESAVRSTLSRKLPRSRVRAEFPIRSNASDHESTDSVLTIPHHRCQLRCSMAGFFERCLD